ncbi:hypothetical protein ACFSTE_22765 [Aquimarina hainanensis]|uniref:Uncharacterized protein n=1 Tax=Aquimarina hainanensis TaxID=1578017 RepID=A0ABW5NHG5_9FLAO
MNRNTKDNLPIQTIYVYVQNSKIYLSHTHQPFSKKTLNQKQINPLVST